MFDVLPMAGDSERNYVRSSLTVTRDGRALEMMAYHHYCFIFFFFFPWQKLGVDIYTSTSVKRMEAVDPGQSVRLFYESSDKQSLTADVDRVLLTAGQSVVCPELRCTSTSSDSECIPFPVTSRGKVESDEFSRARGFETFFVIGDVAEVRSEKQERPCPPTAQVAFQVRGWVAVLGLHIKAIGEKKKERVVVFLMKSSLQCCFHAFLLSFFLSFFAIRLSGVR